MTHTSIIKFKIKSKQTAYWFWVYIYGTESQMHHAAQLHAKETGETIDYAKAEASGICHTYQILKVSPDGKDQLLKEIGTIRLSRENLSSRVVSHEVLHAALHNYRIHYKRNADFGDMVNQAEEDLAYIFADLFKDMNIKLHDHKLWN